MRKIILPRCMGKTQKLIRMSHETCTYILVANVDRQRQIAYMAREMKLDIPFPVTVNDYLRTQFRGSFIKHILIDDAEDVLKQVFSTVVIDAITLTSDNNTIMEVGE